MLNNTGKLIIILGISLLASPLSWAGHAADNLDGGIEKTKKELNYRKHILTGTAAYGTLLGSAYIGSQLGAYVIDKDIATWLHRVLKVDIPLGAGGMSKVKLLFATGLTPIILTVAAGLYVLYKTPQWTDTYVLKKDDKRTMPQNIITFLNRLFVPFFGIITGEYIAH